MAPGTGTPSPLFPLHEAQAEGLDVPSSLPPVPPPLEPPEESPPKAAVLDACTPATSSTAPPPLVSRRKLPESFINPDALPGAAGAPEKGAGGRGRGRGKGSASAGEALNPFEELPEGAPTAPKRARKTSPTAPRKPRRGAASMEERIVTGQPFELAAEETVEDHSPKRTRTQAERPLSPTPGAVGARPPSPIGRTPTRPASPVRTPGDTGKASRDSPRSGSPTTWISPQDLSAQLDLLLFADSQDEVCHRAAAPPAGITPRLVLPQPAATPKEVRRNPPQAASPGEKGRGLESPVRQMKSPGPPEPPVPKLREPAAAAPEAPRKPEPQVEQAATPPAAAAPPLSPPKDATATPSVAVPDPAPPTPEKVVASRPRPVVSFFDALKDLD